MALSEQFVVTFRLFVKEYIQKGSGTIFSRNTLFDQDKNYRNIALNLNALLNIFEKEKDAFDETYVMTHMSNFAIQNMKENPYFINNFITIFQKHLPKITFEFKEENLAFQIIPTEPHAQIQLMDKFLQHTPVDEKLKKSYYQLTESYKNMEKEYTALKKNTLEHTVKSQHEIQTLQSDKTRLEKELEKRIEESHKQKELLKNQNLIQNLAKLLEGGQNLLPHRPIGLQQETPPPPPPPFIEQKEHKPGRQNSEPTIPDHKEKRINKLAQTQPALSFLEQLKGKQLQKKSCELIYQDTIDLERIQTLKISGQAIYLVSPAHIVYYNPEKKISCIVNDDPKRIDFFIQHMKPQKEGRMLTQTELRDIYLITEHDHTAKPEKNVSDIIYENIRNHRKKLRENEDSEESSENDFDDPKSPYYVN